MIARENLDLDRLHKATEIIINGGYRYRQLGTTTAYLHLMLGEVMLADRGARFLYMTKTVRDTELVCRSFYDLITNAPKDAFDWLSYDPIITHTRRGISLESGTRFMFGSVDTMRSDMCGNRYERIFLDLNELQVSKLKASNKLSDIHIEMSIAVSSNGDII